LPLVRAQLGDFSLDLVELLDIDQRLLGNMVLLIGIASDVPNADFLLGR